MKLVLSFFTLWIFSACTGADRRVVFDRSPVFFLNQLHFSMIHPESWANLPGWRDDPLIDALGAFQQQCHVLSKMQIWQSVCETSKDIDEFDTRAIRKLFENYFDLFQLRNLDGSQEGLITGYYEPLLRGSRKKIDKFIYPLYHWPDNVSRGSNLPERRSLVFSDLLKGNELLYLDDPIEAFFLQVQGSGRILLEEGGVVKVGFDGSNNHPYRSIASWLIEKKEITPGEGTIDGIKKWVKKNPRKLSSLLSMNPRFVFFRILPEILSENNVSFSFLSSSRGPMGTLGVPLTPERSVAVDPATIPLGTPMFLSTWNSFELKALNRLVFAQDTGSAIKGVIRADYFFGLGPAAEYRASRMKQQGRIWLLIPRKM